MPLFDARLGRRSRGKPGPVQVPAGFEALAEALDDDQPPLAAARELGHRLAAEGAAIEDVLRDLAVTHHCCGGAGDPPFDVVRAVCSAWADASLRYLHTASCDDPLTGLSTLAHVRTKLAETYRAARSDGRIGPPPTALVVVDVAPARHDTVSHLGRALRLADVAELLRHVFSGDETIGRLTASRAVAVVRRDAQLAGSLAGVRELLADWHRRGGPPARVWIEGLPASPDSAGPLLDELAR